MNNDEIMQKVIDERDDEATAPLSMMKDSVNYQAVIKCIELGRADQNKIWIAELDKFEAGVKAHPLFTQKMENNALALISDLRAQLKFNKVIE